MRAAAPGSRCGPSAASTEVEAAWLKRVREYQIADEITITPDEAPQLLQTSTVPEAGQPGADLQLRLFLKDRLGNLLPDGVFVRDERTHRVLQAQLAPEKNAAFMTVALPVETNCSPGQYKYQITAVDEAGNLRHWSSSYTVVSR